MPRRQISVLVALLAIAAIMLSAAAPALASHPDPGGGGARTKALAGHGVYMPIAMLNSTGQSSIAPQVINAGVCAAARDLSCGGSDSGNNGAPGATNQIGVYSCVGWNESGPEYAYRYVVTETQLVTVRLSDMTADLDVFVLEDAEGCQSSNCLAFGDTQASFEATPGKTYYLVVDGFSGAVGDYTLSASCTGTPSSVQETHDVHVQLLWTQSTTASRMLDLHLVRPGGSYWSALDDAHYENRITPWGAQLARDCNGWDCAQEDIYLDAPVDSGAFGINVHYWGPNEIAEAPTVRIWFKGDTTPSYESRLQAATGGHTWHVGEINWPDKTVVFDGRLTPD